MIQKRSKNILKQPRIIKKIHTPRVQWLRFVDVVINQAAAWVAGDLRVSAVRGELARWRGSRIENGQLYL
jgi:hypothetical protein